MKYKVLIISGEASSDLPAARLLKEIKKKHEVECYGVGGKHLQAEGLETIADASQLNVVGVFDWLDRSGQVFEVYRRVSQTIQRRTPDCAILMDLPDFNLAMAKKLKAKGVPVIYYISPQVWAWRRYRVKKIKRVVDRVLVVFPFEKDFYEKHGVSAEFVGHPLMETLSVRKAYRTHEQIQRAPKIGVLPGSRLSELRYHIPLLRQVTERLKWRFPHTQFYVPIAPTLSPKKVTEQFRGLDVHLVFGKATRLMESVDVALVASGTATLEAALVGTPFTLFYRVSPASAFLFKTFVRYKGLIGMPNILLKEEVAQEYFQNRANAENLIEELLKLVQDESYRRWQVERFNQCREILGHPGASERAAQQVIHLLRNRESLVGSPVVTGTVVS